MKDQSSFIDRIRTFLEIGSGALLIAGPWGCGKTYFIKNQLFKELENNYEPLIVSLYGLKDITELPRRIATEYINKLSNKKEARGKSVGNLIKWGTKLVDAFPKVKEYIDISKFVDDGVFLYRCLPKNTVLFLDDFERAVTHFNINQLLGAINEIVENKEIKTVIVANKDYLDNYSQKNVQYKEDNIDVFYEKVIEKTIIFEADIFDVYKSIVNLNNDADFHELMLNKYMQDVMRPTDDTKMEQKQMMLNIRTLKFAVSHFYEIVRRYKNEGIDVKTKESTELLRNQWIFVYALSIELKRNKLTSNNDHGLSIYNHKASLEINLDLNDEQEVNFGADDEDESGINYDENFLTRFYKTYYSTNKTNFIYYREIYDFVISGCEYDAKQLYDYTRSEIKKYSVELNPAQAALETMMQGYWQYSEKEIINKLNQILKGVKDATLISPISYYNASVYILKFCESINITQKEALDSFREGIKKYFMNKEVSQFDMQIFSIKPIEKETDCSQVYEMLKVEMNRRLEECQEKGKKELCYLFKTDLTQFVDCLVSNCTKSTLFISNPILQNITDLDINERVNNLEPKDVWALCKLVKERPKNLIPNSGEEDTFYRSLKEALATRLEDKSITSRLIREVLYKYLEDKE